MATQERELTDEGKRLWENMQMIEEVLSGKAKAKTVTKPKPIKLDKISRFELEVAFFRTELRRMIRNSELVIEDCDALISKCGSEKAYLALDAKVAKFVHLNFIERVKKVLDLKPAFDHEIVIPEEE